MIHWLEHNLVVVHLSPKTTEYGGKNHRCPEQNSEPEYRYSVVISYIVNSYIRMLLGY
jgi:hypothetical protein